MRPSSHDTFMEMAATISRRATCNRLHVGAVLTKDNAVLTMGYNGAPSGMPHCDDVGCLLIDNHCKRTVHAERNAIIWSAKRGPSIQGSTLYLTHSPCFDCLTLMVQVGVEQIIFGDWYPQRDDRVVAMCQHNRISLCQYTHNPGGPGLVMPVKPVAPAVVTSILFNKEYRHA